MLSISLAQAAVVDQLKLLLNVLRQLLQSWKIPFAAVNSAMWRGDDHVHIRCRAKGGAGVKEESEERARAVWRSATDGG